MDVCSIESVVLEKNSKINTIKVEPNKVIKTRMDTLEVGRINIKNTYKTAMTMIYANQICLAFKGFEEFIFNPIQKKIILFIN